MNEEQNYFLLVLCPFSRIYTYENGPVWTFFSLEGAWRIIFTHEVAPLESH